MQCTKDVSEHRGIGPKMQCTKEFHEQTCNISVTVASKNMQHLHIPSTYLCYPAQKFPHIPVFYTGRPIILLLYKNDAGVSLPASKVIV